jgi:hemerythrin-like domain-containing protein
MKDKDTTRRAILLRGAPLLGAAVTLVGSGHLFAASSREQEKQEEEGEVTPAEDLMREHGALNRILLIYDEAIGRINAKKDFPPEVLRGAASIVRRFIEEYHERLEEENLFPLFEKAGKLVDLVGVLKQQHKAGRGLTAVIERAGPVLGQRAASDRERLLRSLRLFVRMYRPHEAREDTVLFPALHEIVSPPEYEELGEKFETREHQLFGEGGFEKIVEEIAGLEKKVGLYDLSRFTPTEVRS